MAVTETKTKTTIHVETMVKASQEKVWKYWNEPTHITKWCYASDDWHAPHAENDLRVNGKFSTTMAAKDGSMSFDFWGIYNVVEPYETIEYTLGDGRKVMITFSNNGKETKIRETFEAEHENSIEMQKNGWQAILDNFKKYTEVN